MPLTYDNPVVDRDFADPGVFWDTISEKWYAYSTNAHGFNIQCAYSSDFCTWHLSAHDVLPGPFPPWTGKPGFFWAPEVREAPMGKRGGYLMYLSCHDYTTGVMCVASAYSSNGPLGPFHFVGSGPIVSQGYLGGTIDPQPFFDPVSNDWYLIFKNDGNHQMKSRTRIWIQRLGQDGTWLVDQPWMILEPSKVWQNNLIEAPYLYYHPASSTYILFVSSGFFGGEEYRISFATSSSLLGPFQTHEEPFLQTDPSRGIYGPGGQCVVEGPEGSIMMAFHAHYEAGGQGGRRMCVHRIEFDKSDGRPKLCGKPHTRHRLTLGKEEEGDNPREPPTPSPSSSPYLTPPVASFRGKEAKKRAGKQMKRAWQWIKDY